MESYKVLKNEDGQDCLEITSQPISKKTLRKESIQNMITQLTEKLNYYKTLLSKFPK